MLVDAFNSKLEVDLQLELKFLSVIKCEKIFSFVKAVGPDHGKIGRSETEGVEDVDSEEGEE